MNDTRAQLLIEYLYNVIDTLVNDTDYQIKADFLDNDVNSYSIDKLPTGSTEEKFITGIKIKRDIFTFRSRFRYTSSQAEELKNVGFFEKFEELIEYNNSMKILPDIEGIQSIQCLNCGSVRYTSENTCEMNIQIKITYIKEKTEQISL